MVGKMGKLIFGSLRDAWPGEATDFTPLLAEQVDELGKAIGLNLSSVGKVEVATDGGRRIDILVDGIDDATYVIENQYGALNHDHLTRGLAYAVASHSKGLIVVAEKHRDEFRAVARYLNDVNEGGSVPGVAVWLVEVTAVSIEGSVWAPMFQAVVSPNAFTSEVEAKLESSRRLSRAEFDAHFESEDCLHATSELLAWWKGDRRKFRIMAKPPQVVLEARGPGVAGWRSVISVYPDGKVFVPFDSYAGLNTGIPVTSLQDSDFRSAANQLFDLKGNESRARTVAGWLTTERLADLKTFCDAVAVAYERTEAEYYE